MEFSWDSRKSEANLALRGFDGPTLERADTGEDYSEARIIAIGLAQGIPLAVVYTDRTAGGRRIISARRSNRRERESYERALQAR